jgi:pilus assembly protein CpaB
MKQSRTVVVLAVAVATAGLAAFAVYKAVQNMPVREVEVGSVPVVVASKTVAVGTRLTADDLRVVQWPARSPVAGAYADPKEVVDRGVIETVAENEPITSRKVASREAGAGLPPVIPAGMRAMSVRVNEVVGVAGFVLPGTRVDVLVSVNNDGSGSGSSPMARTVISNAVVLTAGTRYDQEAAKEGQPERVTVVTLAVLPEDGERIALASAQGQISLALRNPTDVDDTDTQGIKMAALMRGGNTPPPVVDVVQRRVVRAAPRPAPVAALTPPPAPSIYKVETIRAAKRTEEVVN